MLKSSDAASVALQFANAIYYFIFVVLGTAKRFRPIGRHASLYQAMVILRNPATRNGVSSTNVSRSIYGKVPSRIPLLSLDL